MRTVVAGAGVKTWPVECNGAASERSEASHASGAGQWGPASECVGGSGGAKPPG